MARRIWVATRKGLFEVADVRGAWRIERGHFLGDNVSMIWLEAGSSRVLAALDHGHFGVKLQRSDDAGATWRECVKPSYPAKPDDLEDLDPMRGQPVPWDVKKIWSLERGGDGTLWCGTLPGGLFRSRDDGESWELMRSLWDDPRRRKWMGGGEDWAGIHSILINPADPRHLTIGVSVGGVWETTDGGDHWQLIGAGQRNEYLPPEQQGDPLGQDPHRIAQCPAVSRRQWMQHHNGIFVSDDYGRNWREIRPVAPSAFGFAVAVHPTDPDTAWFVPAIKDEKRYPVDGHLLVNRTRDGGVTFQALDRGLPTRHAYDLIYRHALAVDGSGETLAMGSTTGGLWIGEGQGERWTAVSNRLPPIYALRFA